jgi:putative tryptophan/tyrosine transport system substrate-binding protein
MTRVERRGFIVGTFALLAAPLECDAQPPGKIYRIGLLYGVTGFDPSADPTERALVEGLRERGYVIGQNLVIELRSAYGKWERLPDLAGELVKIPVDLILVPGPRQARVAKEATSTIPIVFGAFGVDPVELGVVQSLAHPGGNVTGTTTHTTRILGKRFELLTETLPNLARVAMLVNPDWPPELMQQIRTQGQTDAARLGLQLQFVEARMPGDLPRAFTALTRQRAQALVVPGDAMFSGAANVQAIVDLALRHRLPGIYDERQFVTAGGLMTYAANLEAIWRRTAGYVDRILKGAKPGDLPVEEPTVFDLVINLKTAKSLGLTIPPAVLARADEIIQ